MADDNTVVWLYNPSFALAVFATVIYSISFVWIFYLTVIKYRAWFFVCVVIGSAIEVVGYAIRCYSAKKQTEVVSYLGSVMRKATSNHPHRVLSQQHSPWLYWLPSSWQQATIFSSAGLFDLCYLLPIIAFFASPPIYLRESSLSATSSHSTYNARGLGLRARIIGLGKKRESARRS